MISHIFIIAIAALSLNWVTIYEAEKFGLVATPNARRVHKGNIPVTGGIAIFFTVLFGTVALSITPYNIHTLIIATLVFAVGVYDDIFQIRATKRLLIQYGSGVLLATYGGIVIVDAGNLLGLGNIPLLMLSVPLTALSVAGLTNAYNMIDGIDGLAASTILLPLIILFILASIHGHPMSAELLLLIVPLCVFLLFNLGPNNRVLPKIFLGDGGSVTLGFLVTASLIYFSQGENALIRPVTALWLVSVPLMDMIATMLRRWRRGHNVMAADRSHLHHTLINKGLSPRKTLMVMLAYALCCALAGLGLEHTPESLSLLLYTLLFVAHCVFVIRSDRHSDIAVDSTKSET